MRNHGDSATKPHTLQDIQRFYKKGERYQGLRVTNENICNQVISVTHPTCRHCPPSLSRISQHRRGSFAASPKPLIIRFAPLRVLRHDNYFKQRQNHHLACFVFHLKLQVATLTLEHLQVICPTQHSAKYFILVVRALKRGGGGNHKNKTSRALCSQHGGFVLLSITPKNPQTQRNTY